LCLDKQKGMDNHNRPACFKQGPREGGKERLDCTCFTRCARASAHSAQAAGCLRVLRLHGRPLASPGKKENRRGLLQVLLCGRLARSAQRLVSFCFFALNPPESTVAGGGGAAVATASKRSRTLSGRNVVEGKDFKSTAQRWLTVVVGTSLGLRPSGKLNEGSVVDGGGPESGLLQGPQREPLSLWSGCDTVALELWAQTPLLLPRSASCPSSFAKLARGAARTLLTCAYAHLCLAGEPASRLCLP